MKQEVMIKYGKDCQEVDNLPQADVILILLYPPQVATQTKFEVAMRE
jgi:hypothetical protein